jgi:hypothetical protein
MLTVLAFSVKLNRRKYMKIEKVCSFGSAWSGICKSQVRFSLRNIFFLYNLSACPCIWSAVQKLAYAIKNVFVRDVSHLYTSSVCDWCSFQIHCNRDRFHGHSAALNDPPLNLPRRTRNPTKVLHSHLCVFIHFSGSCPCCHTKLSFCHKFH